MEESAAKLPCLETHEPVLSLNIDSDVDFDIDLGWKVSLRNISSAPTSPFPGVLSETSIGLFAPGGYHTLCGSASSSANADAATRVFTGRSPNNTAIGWPTCLGNSTQIELMGGSPDAMLEMGLPIESQQSTVALRHTISPMQLTASHASRDIASSSLAGYSPRRPSMSLILTQVTDCEALIVPLQRLRKHLPLPGKSDMLGKG